MLIAALLGPYGHTRVAVPLTTGTPVEFSGSLGSAGASAATVPLIGPAPQVANPCLVIAAKAHPGGIQDCGDIGCGPTVQFTGKGVTLTGGALKVPVATNCAWPFPACGLTEIDSSTRLELPPQLSMKRAVSRSANVRETRTSMPFI